MAFSNNKKTKMVAAVVADKMDYVKKSKSYLSESELKNKKYGKTYTVYIPDPGKVVDGLVANPDTVNEIEYEIELKNKNTSVNIDSWNDLVDIESFRDEIALPKGTKLAQTVQDEIVDNNVIRSAQAVVGKASFATLAKASAKLRKAANAGTKVSFVDAEAMAEIASAGLSNFIPDSIQKDIYGKSYLGEYAGASQIELEHVPTVTGTGSAATITLEENADGTGFEPVDTVSVAGGKKGEAYKATGLKLVDLNGIESDAEYVIILESDADASGEAKIGELRITFENEAAGNPNAWVPAGTASLTLTPMLETGTEYYVCQVRTEDALGFDTYKFSDLPGSENETQSIDNVSVKMSKYGNGTTMETLVRLDLPFAAGTPETRKSVTMYIEK